MRNDTSRNTDAGTARNTDAGTARNTDAGTARNTDAGTARTRGTIRTVVSGLVQLLGDLLAVSLWVLFLTILFLETAWPRWAFYALLVVGVGAYVTVTAGWMRGGDT